MDSNLLPEDSVKKLGLLKIYLLPKINHPLNNYQYVLTSSYKSRPD